MQDAKVSLEWPLISHSKYSERLRTAKDTIDSNGFGTVLFLSGMRPIDTFYEEPFYRNVLSYLVEAERPIPGWIMTFERRIHNEKTYVPFTGIITRVEPRILITHRFHGNDLTIDQPLEEALGELIYQRLDSAFYRPEQIEELL